MNALDVARRFDPAAWIEHDPQHGDLLQFTSGAPVLDIARAMRQAGYHLALVTRLGRCVAVQPGRPS